MGVNFIPLKTGESYDPANPLKIPVDELINLFDGFVSEVDIYPRETEMIKNGQAEAVKQDILVTLMNKGFQLEIFKKRADAFSKILWFNWHKTLFPFINSFMNSVDQQKIKDFTLIAEDEGLHRHWRFIKKMKHLTSTQSEKLFDLLNRIKNENVEIEKNVNHLMLMLYFSPHIYGKVVDELQNSDWSKSEKLIQIKEKLVFLVMKFWLQ